MSFSLRIAALATFITLAAVPAFAGDPYALQYQVKIVDHRFAFEVTVTHLDTGSTIMRSTLRTRPREWGELETGHAGRKVRVRVMGHPNGYAEVVLDVREGSRVIQHSLFKYTERAAAPPVKWRGDPITLHLRDADLVDVLLAFAEITGASIAVDPNVTGTVTLDLVDVPWDQALDLILRQNGLTKQVQGSVTFVRK